MPRPCSVCSHPEREAIEEASQTESYRIVSNRYGISKPALQRHLANCVRRSAIEETAKAALAERAPVAPEDQPRRPAAYQELLTMKDKLALIIERTEAEGDTKMTLEGMREMRAMIETVVKVYEVQLRLDREYSADAGFSTTTVARFLRARAPGLLKELCEVLRAEKEGR